jgi:hypothetical protein
MMRKSYSYCIEDEKKEVLRMKRKKPSYLNGFFVNNSNYS